jgi:hypothetical protein
MTDEQQKICLALENCQDSYLSQQDREKIAAQYGEDIAVKVKALYDDALNCPVDWRTATIDTALPVLHKLLASKYPWLSAKARTYIVGAFVMEWK